MKSFLHVQNTADRLLGPYFSGLKRKINIQIVLIVCHVIKRTGESRETQSKPVESKVKCSRNVLLPF